MALSLALVGIGVSKPWLDVWDPRTRLRRRLTNNPDQTSTTT